MAVDESKAPVKKERISPDDAGKALESWKHGIKINGPPRARDRYPRIWAI